MALSAKKQAEFKMLVASGILTAKRQLFPSAIKTLRKQGCIVEPLEKNVLMHGTRSNGIKCQITFPPDWTPEQKTE